MNFSESRPVQRGSAVPIEAGDSTKSPFLWELLRILGRRRTTIILIMVLSFLSAIAYLATTPPRFTATTVMVLDTNHMQLFAEQGGDAVDQAAVESQVETIKSEKVTSQVIKKLDLTNDPEFKPSPPSLINRAFGYFDSFFSVPDPKTHDDTPDDAAMRTATHILNSCLKVTHLARTYNVEIAVTTLDKEKSVKIANETGEAYHQRSTRGQI